MILQHCATQPEATSQHRFSFDAAQGLPMIKTFKSASVVAALAALTLVVPASALAQTGSAGAPGAAQSSSDAPLALSEPRNTTAVSYDDITATVRPWIMALPGVRGVLTVDGSPNLLRVIADRTYTVNLEQVHARLNVPGADRDEEYGRFMGALQNTLAANDPFKPEAFRTILRPTAAIDEFEVITGVNGVRNVVVRREILPGIEEVVVAEQRTSIAFLPAARLQDLGLDAEAAFALGRANLVDVARTATWAEEDGIRIATIDGVFEPSLMVVDPLWDQLAADMGGPVAVAVPVRGRILVARADQPDMLARLKARAAAEATGDLAISPQVFLRTADGWVVAP